MGLKFRFNSEVGKREAAPRIQLVLIGADGSGELLTEFESPVRDASLLADLDVECTEIEGGMRLDLKALLMGTPKEVADEPPLPVSKKRAGRPKGSTNKPKAEKIAEVKAKVAETKAKETPEYTEEAKKDAGKTPTEMFESKKDESKKTDDRRTVAAAVATKVVEEARAKAKGKNGERETFVDGEGRTIDAATGEVLKDLGKALGGKGEAAPASADPF